jgi:hypothetical protein
MPIAVGQELALDFEFRPAGVQESVTVVGVVPMIDISSARVGVNVSERDVQNLPVNGRQMSQLMLQAPGSQTSGTGAWQDIRFSERAVEQNVIKYDGIEGSAIIDASPGNVNGESNTPFKLQASLENVQEFRVESSGYPPELGTGTGGQVSVVTKSGGNSVPWLDFRVSAQQQARCAQPLRCHEKPGRQRHSEAAQVAAEAEPVRGLAGRPGGQKSRVLLRQLRRLSPRRGDQLRGGRPKCGRVGARRSGARGVARRLSVSNAVVLPSASSNADFDIAQLRSTQKVTGNSFGGRFDYKFTDNWSTYVRVFHDQGTSKAPEGVTGRALHGGRSPRSSMRSARAQRT